MWWWLVSARDGSLVVRACDEDSACGGGCLVLESSRVCNTTGVQSNAEVTVEPMLAVIVPSTRGNVPDPALGLQ
jgi:hypothetical protein